MNVHIRTATDSDIPAIAAIYAHHVRTGCATFELEAPPEEEMRERWSRIQALGYPYVVAEVDQTIAGYAYASQYRPRPGYRYTVEDSIYLNPMLLGQGIGSKLLTAVISACEEKGLRQMIAVIGDSANSASIRLHEKFGFRLVGTLQASGFKFGRWVDSVLMQRALGEGSGSLPE